jgi:hypothetical protein
MMDAYLSQEALRSVKAQAFGTDRRTTGGFLVGHKRGQRFFVERAYPSSGSNFSSPERYRTLDRLFEGKIIGFYSSNSSAKALATYFHPSFYGKLVLLAGSGSRGRLSLNPHVVEFEKSFFLLPIRLCSRPKGKK